MIAKLIGYLIGGMFIAALFSPIPVSLWLVHDRVDAFTNSVVQPATITRCYSHRSSGSNSRLSFGPVATTNKDQDVKGSFRWSKRKWCESDIGNSVSVLINTKEPENSKIFTFSQFWFMPLLFLLISFVIYPAMYIAKRKKLREKK